MWPLMVPLLALAAAWSPDRTREQTVPGREAWEVARRQGFEFYPVLPDARYVLSGPRDGVATRLKLCRLPGLPCDTEAELLAGAMTVLEPRCPGRCARVHTFEMFAGRRLAPGWRVARFELSGGRYSWGREPRYGTANASFALQLEARPGLPVTVTIRSITLVGPADTDWRQAFAAR